MRYKIVSSLQAQLVDHDGAVVSSKSLQQKVDGLACHADSVLNYAELDFAEECEMRGGHPRLALDEKGKLAITIEVDSLRRLSRNELRALRADFEGQLTDGVGAGCFDELSVATGVAVEIRFPLRSKCKQMEGTAWRPKTTTKKGNDRRIAAAKKLVEKMDAVDSVPTRKRKTASQVTTAVSKPDKKKQKRPNFKKLLRLLAKPERLQFFDQIKTELEACGGDLSQLGDGELPYGNFNDPKLLRLLLKAGLPPETTDVKGHTLLVQGAGNAKCLELLLKQGVDVNRFCDSYHASTALIRAASFGKLKSVEVLLAAGADVTIKDKSGKLAQDLVDKYSRDRGKILDLFHDHDG